MKHSISIWVGVNKNNSIICFTSQPIRNNKLGIWESKDIFINSIFYDEIKELIKQSNQTWESDAEYFEISF